MGAPEKLPPSSNNSMQRVKVYRLSDEGKWDDQGTGHVSVDFVDRSEDLGLFVIDEEENETLLFHRISSEDIYRKQEGTIISWRDPEFSTDMALSFQETTGCTFIWDQICNVQRNMHFATLNNESFHNVNSELRELPPVELSTLPLIHKTVLESGITDQLRVTELILLDQDFFPKLMNLFRICEDLENIESLHMIFKIVRGIIFLNSPQIYEKLFSDELFMDVIGCLEYDPDVSRAHHRDFLKEHVVFKEAIPIKDPLVLSKIHQTYRLGYLKDVIFPRVLDEAIVANLNSIIHSNNALVVSLLKDDSTFIHELFVKLKSPSTSAELKKNLVQFLHEFCTLSKSLQMVQQIRLYRELINEGIFDIISDVLQSEDKKLVLTGTDILILFLNQDPNLLCSYVIRPEGVSLFGLLVKGMLTDFGDDMHCQFLEIIRSLLDSYTTGVQRDAIVEIFYEKHLGQVIDVITSSCPSSAAVRTADCFSGQVIDVITSPCPSSAAVRMADNSVGSSGESGSQGSLKPEILLNICDLLCFCVLHHPYRIKCNFLLNNVIDKVLLLTRRRENYLVVAAVRFLRTLISRNDEHLMHHITRHNLLKPVIDVFVANGTRYNLLNSAILELFEHIRKDNLKILLKYLVETFWNQLVGFENFPTIQSLKVKYEQYLESSGARSTITAIESRKRIDERAPEKEEEDYFNEDSDEEDSALAVSNASRSRSQASLSNGSVDHPSPRPGGLVDYDDDEDDEDYKPPPRKQPDDADEDEGVVESLQLKRKSAPKNEPEPKRLQRALKSSKPIVFTALCSTLSQVVLPSKKNASPSHSNSSSDLDSDKDSPRVNHEEKGSKGSVSSSEPDPASGLDTGNHPDEEDTPKAAAVSKSCSVDLQSSPDSRQRGDDCPLIPPKSSPEMAVNGS